MPNQPAELGDLLSLLTSYTVVDLTVPLAENLPANWPTHMPFQRKLYNYMCAVPNQLQPVYDFRGPYHTAWLVLDEHCGTHIDSPSHFIPRPDSGLPNAAPIGNVTLEQLNLTS